MEQELRFGLDLGQLALLKKNGGPIMRAFFMFSFLFFAHENMKKPASKAAHNRPPIFFSVMPTGPNPAQISIPVP